MDSKNSALLCGRIGVPLCSVAAAVAAVLSTVQPVFAQDASGGEALSEVVVTGSRIVRRDYNSDSPVVTVSSDALTNTSEIGVEQSLNSVTIGLSEL